MQPVVSCTKLLGQKFFYIKIHFFFLSDIQHSVAAMILHSFLSFFGLLHCCPQNFKISVSLFTNSFLLTGVFQHRWDAGRCTHSEFQDPYCISIHSLDSVNLSQTIELSKYLKSLPCPIYFKWWNVNNHK